MKKQIQESLRLNITNSSTFVKLQESEDGSKKPIFRVIKPGWSDNGFYYPSDVTPQLVPFIESKPVFFNQHLEPKDRKDMIFGHQLPNAVAVAEKVWAEDNGEVMVILKPFEGPNKWIFEASMENAGMIGNSIDASGKVKIGEAEGKKGKIVEQFMGYNSTDFVYRPAAGGGFISLTEASKLESQEESTKEIQLKEAIESFKDYLEKKHRKTKFWDIGQNLINFLYEIIAWNDGLTEEEKTKVFEDALNEFVSELKQIDPVSLFNANQNEQGFNSQLVQLGKKLEGSMISDEVKKVLESLTPEVLLASAPTLFKSVEAKVLESQKVSNDSKRLQEATNEVKELLEKVQTLTDEKEALIKQKEDQEAELAKFRESENAEKKKEEVNQLIKDSEIPEDLLTESFKNRLYKIESTEEIQEMIKDRMEISKKVGVKFDNPAPKQQGKKSTTTEVSDDTLIAGIKAN